MPKYIVPVGVLTAASLKQGASVLPEYTRKFLKFLVHNPTAAEVTLEINLCPSGVVPSLTNEVYKQAISAGETDSCSALVGIELAAGFAIYAKGLGLNFSYVANDSTAV